MWKSRACVCVCADDNDDNVEKFHERICEKKNSFFSFDALSQLQMTVENVSDEQKVYDVLSA